MSAPGSSRPAALFALVIGACLLAAIGLAVTSDGTDGPGTDAPGGGAAELEATPTPTPYGGWVDPSSVGEPYGDVVPGVLTFRGNPTRTFYGTGVPTAPQALWRFPAESAEPLCSLSTTGPDTVETTEWCGTGWTGQPAIFERDGQTWVVFGSFDSAVHFLDGDTGERLRPDFAVGDIIKGSVTIDPDGYPIVYVGSATTSCGPSPSIGRFRPSCGHSTPSRSSLGSTTTTGTGLHWCSTTTSSRAARTRNGTS